jgi:hypothetical protein
MAAAQSGNSVVGSIKAWGHLLRHNNRRLSSPDKHPLIDHENA